MAIACLAAETDSAERLAQQGYALLDGSGVDLRAAVASFDALRSDAEGKTPLPCDHPLVRTLLDQPNIRDFLVEILGNAARPISAVAFDQMTQLPVTWHQPDKDLPAPERALVLRWHLDLIGPADGALRVLPGSHRRGHLSPEEIARLVTDSPAAELAVSAGTVAALRPRLVQGSRRRTARGHRRILQVELTAQC